MEKKCLLFGSGASESHRDLTASNSSVCKLGEDFTFPKLSRGSRKRWDEVLLLVLCLLSLGLVIRMVKLLSN